MTVSRFDAERFRKTGPTQGDYNNLVAMAHAIGPRYLNGRTHWLAEDVAAMTLYRASRGISRFEGRAEMDTWMFRILSNVAKREGLRERYNRTISLEDLPEIAAEPEAEQQAEYRNIARAADNLPIERRDVFERFYIQGQTLAEISSETGVPQGTIKRRLSLARRDLRAQLGLTNVPSLR